MVGERLRRLFAGALLLGLVAATACSGGGGSAAEPPAAVDRDKVGSAGCGTSTITAGEEQVNISSGGVERWYIRHVPPAHDGKTPLPVVVDLHGYREGATVHVQITGMGPFGDGKDFITLTPNSGGDVSQWHPAVDSPDVTFIADMLDDVEQNLCVDTAREYVDGVSNGAMMASVLACAMSDRVAAVAAVAGVVGVTNCAPTRPTPVLAIHGTADHHRQYEGGFGPGLDPFKPPPPGIDVSKSVPDTLADWAKRNGCNDTPPTEIEYATGIHEVAWDCPAAVEVVLFRVEGGGHTFPGSEPMTRLAKTLGPTSMEVDARDIIWDFFMKHPLRSAN